MWCSSRNRSRGSVEFVHHEFGILYFDSTLDKLKDTLSSEFLPNFRDNLTPRSTTPITGVLSVPRPLLAGSRSSLLICLAGLATDIGFVRFYDPL